MTDSAFDLSSMYQSHVYKQELVITAPAGGLAQLGARPSAAHCWPQSKHDWVS